MSGVDFEKELREADTTDVSKESVSTCTVSGVSPSAFGVLKYLMLKGNKAKVVVPEGWNGCVDVQNACTKEGFVTLGMNGFGEYTMEDSKEELMRVDSTNYVRNLVNELLEFSA